MAAPCFCTSRVLSADLQTLGYPSASNAASVSHAGQARLDTLAWLAYVVDPTFEGASKVASKVASEDALAAFWDRLGLHVAPRNSAGHRVPLTVAGDKARERAAAALYLRSAIDLALSFRRRRLAEETGDGEEGEHGTAMGSEAGDEREEVPLFDAEDLEANAVLGTLIMNRHVLFPSTVHLLNQPQGKKRRPLAQRKPGNLNRGTFNRQKPPKALSAVKKEGVDAAKKPKTREHILERLRAIQRETQDLQSKTPVARVASEFSSNKGNVESESGPAVEMVKEDKLQDEEVMSLASAGKELTKLVAEFESISTSSLAFRDQRTDLAKPDAAANEKISAVAVECRDLVEEVRNTLTAAHTLQSAVSTLVHGRCVLENLSDSSAVRGVVEYGRRIEKHV